MVKLRGVNVFPEAIGGVVASERRSNGEYVCIVVRIEQREEMTVRVDDLDDESHAEYFLEAPLEIRL